MFSFSKHTSCAIAISSALFAAAALTGCTKPTTLGSDLVDGDAIYGEPIISDANTSPTADFRMNTITEAEDSLQTYKYSSPAVSMNRFLFGAVNDPVFGKYTSGIYLQPYPNPTKIDATAIADSVFLVLQYDLPSDTTNTTYIPTASRNAVRTNRFKEANIIGDTLPQQSLTVYQLAEQMNNTLISGYYSDKVFATESTLAVFDYTAQPTTLVASPGRNKGNTADSLTGTVLPHLRIKLNNSIVNKLFSKKDSLIDTEVLRNAFKGLYIAPSPNNTCLYRFNLLNTYVALKPSMSNAVKNSASGLVIYYHLPTAPNKPLTYPITFDGLSGATSGVVTSVATTKFTQNRLGTPLANALLASSKKRIGDSVIYVQGMAGTNGKISFPNLGKLKGKVIINKAEITFKAISDATGFSKPLYLGLSHKTTEGAYATIWDINLTNSSSLASTYVYNPSSVYGGKLNGSTYTMNITIALQKMIDGTLSTSDKNQIEKYLYITNLGKLYNAQRVVLGGARNSVYAPVLKVYMTRL
jgi:hypothetical protein